MIDDVIVTRTNLGKPTFVVGYFDSERQDEKGYVRTTKYGTESEMRELLKSCGVPDAEIGELFAMAKV